MRRKAVIFDWDGVIIDSLPMQFEIYKVIEEKLNKKIIEIEDGDFFELDWRETFKNVDIHDEKVWEQAKTIYQEEVKKLIPKIKLFPHVVEIIKKLHPDYKLGIVSNNFAERIKEKLDEQELTQFFDSIIGAEGGVLKPDPTQLIECMSELGVNPEDTIYIGDMDGDIETGKNAKVKKVVAVTYGYHSMKRLKNTEPDAIVDSPEELMEAIR